ncbi:MAG TPA: hypothetical protein VMG82_04590 [Candidatus Sulfotelmatobacter sp.]|nr:hypothetical protein [Candidatus Sulfotelmatobacter sp.]
MRRLITIAAFALFLAVPVWAQRGGHGGGGGHFGGGGMRGGGVAHVSAGRSFAGTHSAGMPSAPGFSRGSSHSFNHGFVHGTVPNHGVHVHHFHANGFHNNCFGYACRSWGWGNWGWGWGWYDPWLWSSWDEQDRRFDEEYYRQYALADQWNQQSIAEQRMREREEAEGDQDVYAPRSSNRPSAPEVASQPAEPTPATVLVFRDRRQQEVQNYAIVGQTLWAFSAGRTQKIPLADLDVSATEKANDDRGVTFRAPRPNEGQ